MIKLLKFGAQWCNPCKVLKERLKDFNECEIIEYDVDECDEELLNKFKVRNIPLTVLVDDNGNEIHKWVGVFDVKQISEKISEIG